MNFNFNLDQRFDELNSEETKAAFYKYVKTTIKNKTPIVLKGVKEDNYWKSDLYECAVPTSHFSSIKIPTDSNIEKGTEIYVSLSDKILEQFTTGTKLLFKGNEINILRGSAKLKITLDEAAEATQEKLNDFLSILNTDTNDFISKVEVTPGADVSKFLMEITSSPEASVFITPTSITLLKESVFCRHSISLPNVNDTIYINMYLANKVCSYLTYCSRVNLIKTENYMIVVGYDSNNNETVRNISSIFEATSDNPSDEDLDSIKPAENATEIKTTLKELNDTLNSQKSLISAFIHNKNYDVKLYKNGNGFSLGFENDDNFTEKALITINVGEVKEEEPDISEFTEYSTILPLATLISLVNEDADIIIKYEDSENTACAFICGEYEVLSGKIW